jgi:ATP-binding cassette subfamily F protein 3
MEHIHKSYPGLPILNNAFGTIEKGDKIALIGANGRGKSTLLRIVAGTDEQFEGLCESGHNVTQTFFAQHQLEALHMDNTILNELQNFAPKHTETELRSILGCFLFTGDDVFKRIKVLSGGEKSRVALAKALTADANLLILDEPTYHLDIQSVNILIQALKQYEGTFIVVSHDRYLLDNVANKIWFIEDQEIKEYPGTYAEYEEWSSKRVSGAKTAAPAPKKEDKKITSPKSENPDKNKELKKLNQQLQNLEAEVAELENEVKLAEEALGKPEIYADTAKLSAANSRYEELKANLQYKHQVWEELAGKIMEIES